MAVVGAIIALGLLIVVHEAGHYFVARWCRMRVDRFSIGFGPAILSWRRRDTVSREPESGAEAVAAKLMLVARKEPNSFVGVVTEAANDSKPARLEYHARDILVRLADDRSKAEEDLLFEVEAFLTKSSIADGQTVSVQAWEQTDFTLAPIPFGGFVQINGMLVQDEVDLRDERAYPNRPTWQRFATIFAGPATNYLFAIFIALILYNVAGLGTHRYYEVSKPMEGYDAYGKLEAGDRILRVDGQEIFFSKVGAENLPTLGSFVNAKKGEPLALTVLRNGEETEISVKSTYVPGLLGEYWESESALVRDTAGTMALFTPKPTYLMGIALAATPLERRNAGFFQETAAAFVYPVQQTRDILTGLWLMIRGKVKGEARGPVGIAQFIKKSFEVGWIEVLSLMMLLNVYLGLFNLLPLPALDGGRLVFLGYEMATRRRANQKVEQTVHMIGFMALFALLIVFTYKDIVRLFE